MESVKYLNLKRISLLIFLAYLFFMLGNGILGLTNPDEVFYAQTAKEMARHQSWMTPYLFGQPQFEKPVLTYWLLRTGNILFGISDFSARFFPALFAMIGIIAVYLLGKIGFREEKKALLSSLILMSCGLYIGLARTVFTDLIFSVLILLSLLFFFWGYTFTKKKGPGLLLFFVFSGLAVLTKGPLGFLIPALTILLFLFIEKNIKFILCRHSLSGLILFLLVSLPWYIFMINKYGRDFTREFFYNDHIRRILEAEHIANDRWYFYPLSMLGCLFPWSLFLAGALIRLPKRLTAEREPFLIFLACWVSAVLLIFQFAHSKLVSYIFPLFPALAFLAADFIYEKLSLNPRSRLIFFILLGTLFFLSLIFTGLSIGSVEYSGYLSSKLGAYCLLMAFAALLMLSISFILRKKIMKSVYSLVLVIPVFLFSLPLLQNDIEPYLSSKKICAYLLGNYSVNNAIISSKFFARGIRYYTDKEIAVLDLPGTPYFSPHAVTFLNSDQKVMDFLRSQGPTYCILKRKNLVDIDRIAGEAGKEFKYAILKKIGNEYLLKIEYPAKN